MMFPTYPRLYFHWKNPQKAHGFGCKQGIARLYNAFLEGFVEGTTPYTFPRETRGKAMLSTLDVSKNDRGSYSLKAPPSREGELAEEIRRNDSLQPVTFRGPAHSARSVRGGRIHLPHRQHSHREGQGRSESANGDQTDRPR